MHIWNYRPPKIHWRKYMTRKVIILACFVVASTCVNTYMHFALLDHAHELAMGTLFEHLIFGIPMEE